MRRRIWISVLALTFPFTLFSWDACASSHHGTRIHHARSDRFLFRAAKEEFRTQHDRLSEKTLTELLASHPGSVFRGPALLLIARIHAREALKKGARNFREPLFYFRQAGNVLPEGWDKGEVLYRKGRYLIRQRFGAEGRGILEQLLSRYPQSPWAFQARLAIADSWRERGDLQKAEKILAEARASLSKSFRTDRIRYEYLRGHLQLDRGDLSGAEMTFLSALSLSKAYPYSHPEILFLLARTAYALHHNNRSIALFRRFNRLFPDDSRAGEAEYYLARLSGRRGLPSHERARLREVIADNPGTTASHLARIELMRLVFFKEGKEHPPRDLPEMLSRSIRELGRISGEERNQRIAEEAALLRVRLLDRAGNWDKAFREVARLEGRVDPVSRFGKKVQDLEKSLILGRIASLSEPLHPHRIIRLYQSYRYRLPGPQEASSNVLYLALARAYRKTGDKEKAWKDLEIVLSVSKDPAILGKSRRLRYQWLVQDHNEPAAMKWAMGLAKDTALSPSERRDWFSKAASLADKTKNPELEERVLTRWTSSGLPVDNPGETFARLGLLDLGRGEHEKGQAELLRALPEIEGRQKDTPLLGRVLFHLGQESFMRGKRGGARQYWQQMLDCCPSDPHGGWVTYQMGQMALADGHTREARTWFAKTIKQYPREEVARVARLKIKAMALEKKDGDP